MADAKTPWDNGQMPKLDRWYLPDNLFGGLVSWLFNHSGTALPIALAAFDGLFWAMKRMDSPTAILVIFLFCLAIMSLTLAGACCVRVYRSIGGVTLRQGLTGEQSEWIRPVSPFAKNIYVVTREPDQHTVRECKREDAGAIASVALFNSSAYTLTSQIVYGTSPEIRVCGAFIAADFGYLEPVAGSLVELIVCTRNTEHGNMAVDDRRSYQNPTEWAARQLPTNGTFKVTVETWLSDARGPIFEYDLTLKPFGDPELKFIKQQPSV